jgi:pyruvate-formate lyase-activating enzyme
MLHMNARPSYIWDTNYGVQKSVAHSVSKTIYMMRRLQPYRVQGITLSGGEPLAQPSYQAELGMKAALDTSGWGSEVAISRSLALREQSPLRLCCCVGVARLWLGGAAVAHGLELVL